MQLDHRNCRQLTQMFKFFYFCREYQQTEGLRQAVSLYQYCSKFIKSNNLVQQLGLAAACTQMAELIIENSEMMRVGAMKAQRRKQ